jgi:type IV secretory pathway TrbF-like protein
MATALDHPLIDAGATSRHNAVLLDEEQKIRNWQLTAWWALALATISLAVNCLQWLQRKEHYVLTGKDQIGVYRYLGELTAEQAQSVVAKSDIVSQFVRDIRTISTDQKLQADHMNRSYKLCRERAQAFLREYFGRAENDPKALQSKGISRIPSDILVQAETVDSFHVTWTEETTGPTGPTRTAWSGMVTVDLEDPEHLDGTEREQSPLGIFVDYVSWSGRKL